MNNNHQSNHRNRNNQNNRHGKNKPNGQRNQRNENKDPRDKKVPMRYQVRKTKETSSVEFKYNVDGSVEKTKMNVYEDGNDEEYLKLIKDFKTTLILTEFGTKKMPLAPSIEIFVDVSLELLGISGIK